MSSNWAWLRSNSPISIKAGNCKKMLLCCCWPVHKCVTVLSCFDTLIVAITAYKAFNTLADTWGDPHWLTVLFFLFCCAFLVVQLIGTVFIILAHKRNIARYCLPRLVLIAGLIICSAIATSLLIYYFMFGTTAMNEWIFTLYEWFFEELIDEREKIELKSELKLYAAGFLTLFFTFCLYSCFEFLLTRKFYLSLNHFAPVSQHEPTAPQQAYNPEYAAPPTKMYPNVA